MQRLKDLLLAPLAWGWDHKAVSAIFLTLLGIGWADPGGVGSGGLGWLLAHGAQAVSNGKYRIAGDLGEEQVATAILSTLEVGDGDELALKQKVDALIDQGFIPSMVFLDTAWDALTNGYGGVTQVPDAPPTGGGDAAKAARYDPRYYRYALGQYQQGGNGRLAVLAAYVVRFNHELGREDPSRAALAGTQAQWVLNELGTSEAPRLPDLQLGGYYRDVAQKASVRPLETLTAPAGP